jgi:hypothetical protein
MPKRMIRREPQKRAQIKDLPVASKEMKKIKGGECGIKIKLIK